MRFDQGSLVVAVRRFGQTPALSSSTLAIDSGDKFGFVVRGPRVLGPHESLAASQVVVPHALLAAMRPPGAPLRLDVAVELELTDVIMS